MKVITTVKTIKGVGKTFGSDVAEVGKKYYVNFFTGKMKTHSVSFEKVKEIIECKIIDIIN